jgi:dTDP-4-dehydrorhamnose reductase
MYKVALTGATGMVGSRIVELLHSKFEFINLSQQQLDITNQDQVWHTLLNLDFDFFLHLAAYTNVDRAESEQETAYKTNVIGTQNIFNVVKKKRKKMIYISTGFVFDGKNPPFSEDSLPNPLGYYGKTKYEGERVLEHEAMIIRFDYPYRQEFAAKKDFVRTIKSLLEQNQPLKMVIDSTMTPTFIDDIAFGLRYLIQNYTPEVFHLVGADSLSPYSAAQLIAQNFNLNIDLIQPITYAQYSQNKAPRPQYSTLISLKNKFWPMKTFNEGLKLLRNQL